VEGHSFSPFHIDNRSAVCILGSDVHDRLFSGAKAIGQMVFIKNGNKAFGCRVLAVAAPHNSNKEWKQSQYANYYSVHSFSKHEHTVGVPNPAGAARKPEKVLMCRRWV
jgi:hypothetical protein